MCYKLNYLRVQCTESWVEEVNYIGTASSLFIMFNKFTVISNEEYLAHTGWPFKLNV